MIGGPRRRVVATAVAVVLAGAACSSDGDAGSDDVLTLENPQDRSIVDDNSIETMPQLEGERFPDVTVFDVDGAEVSTASLVGEPLVVNFWFTTCPPCAKELADFADVDAEVDDVRFVGMNPSPTDPIPAMIDFAAERGVTYDLFKDDRLELQTALGITFFPVTVFVGSDGNIIDQTGALDADGLRAEIEELRSYEGALDT